MTTYYDSSEMLEHIAELEAWLAAYENLRATMQEIAHGAWGDERTADLLRRYREIARAALDRLDQEKP